MCREECRMLREVREKPTHLKNHCYVNLIAPRIPRKPRKFGPKERLRQEYLAGGVTKYSV
jgi:hypothetical protein